MATILAITVGGSCAPVVTAVRDFQPEFVLFFASTGSKGSRVMLDGPGKPCADQPNILAQTGLAERKYRIVDLEEPDSLDLCYRQIREALASTSSEHPGLERLADYTGGTKTMSAALVLAGLELGWQLSLVKGTRADLVKVINGTEMASLANTWEVRVQQRLAEAFELFNQYAFASAGKLLEGLLRVAPLNPQTDREIRKWVALCRGFDAWDRYDHSRARQLLEPYQAEIVSQWRFLKTLTALQPGASYEAVFDLVLNAERRAARGRYDDAVARLYRALEMFAQTRMRTLNPSLDPSDLKVESLPEPLQEFYRPKDGASQEGGKPPKIQLGLREDYELLEKLGDPLGLTYSTCAKRVLDCLKKRNNSILAHGCAVLSEADYHEMAAVVNQLLDAGFAALGLKRGGVQFPKLENGKVVPR